MSIVEELEQIRSNCNKTLREANKNDVLNSSSYHSLLNFNNELSDYLLWNITYGRDLLKDELIESIDDLLKVLIDSISPISHKEMFKLITDNPLGDNNTDIRGLTINLAREEVEGKFPPGKLISNYKELQKIGSNVCEYSLENMVEQTIKVQERLKIYIKIIKTEYEQIKHKKNKDIKERRNTFEKKLKKAGNGEKKELIIRITVCDLLIKTPPNKRDEAISELTKKIISVERDRLNNEKKQRTDSLKQKIGFVKKISGRINNFVQRRMEYVPERREFYQPPVHTLMKTRGGDCDDLTMLLCSMWESIGFETTVNIVPEHCAPGIKLLIPFEKKGETWVRICNIIADPTQKKYDIFRLSLKICNGEISLEDFKKLPETIKSFYRNIKTYTVPHTEIKRYYQPIDILRKNDCHGDSSQ